MSIETWIVVADHTNIQSLIETGRELGGPLNVAVVGAEVTAEAIAAAGVDRVCWIEAAQNIPTEAYAATLAQLVVGKSAVLLGGRNASDRVLLGAAAAAMRAPVLTGASQISTVDAGVRVTHANYGGISLNEVLAKSSVALLLDGGAAVGQGSAVPVERISADPAGGVTVLGFEPSSFEQVDLAGAARIVAVGRGLKDSADLALIDSVAAALGAEVGCSRPLAEGLEWFGKDRYVGISGQHVAPTLYLAVGISGQLQHMAGARDASVIVAINNDPKAPIIAESDYALVGDLYTLLPALTAALA